MPRSGMIAPILGAKARPSRSRRKSLADALFTKTQQRVFGVLFGQPERSFYASELIRDAGTGSGAAQRELARLEGSGLIVARRIGHQKHYQANRGAPIFEELHGIVVKTFGLADVLRDALLPGASEIAVAFVYGSVAKRSDTAHSDIDLFVVADTLAYADLMRALAPAEARLARKINPTLQSRADLHRKMTKGNSFVTRVLEQPKIFIIGSADGLAKS